MGPLRSPLLRVVVVVVVVVVDIDFTGVATVARRLRYSYSWLRLILVVVSTVATPGEWQCKIRTGGVRRLAAANRAQHFSNASCYNFVSVLYRFQDINAYFQKFKDITSPIGLPRPFWG